MGAVKLSMKLLEMQSLVVVPSENSQQTDDAALTWLLLWERSVEDLAAALELTEPALHVVVHIMVMQTRVLRKHQHRFLGLGPAMDNRFRRPK